MEGFLLLDACFDAQQAAEKAIKAVLMHRGINFPFTHNLTNLLNLLLRENLQLPDEILQAGRLTEYGVETRYPPSLEDVTPDEYQDALKIAQEVFDWASSMTSG